MKLLMLMLFVVSSATFAAEVGENMKSECTKIISDERNLSSVEIGSEEIVEDSEDAAAAQ